MSTPSTAARPDVAPPAPDVAAIEAVIRRAIDERRRDLVDIVGAGEITIALRWADGPEPCVVKRMPPMKDRAHAEEYMAVVRRHIDELAASGVRCVATTLHPLVRADGKTVVFHCQPLLAADTLADNVLRTRTPDAEDPLVITLVDRTAGAIGAGVPVDPQFANWCWFDDDLWQLDLSSPFMIEDGDLIYDTSGYRREYPWAIRKLVYRELMKLARQYVELDYVLTDVMTQLHRMGMPEWCPPVAEAARVRHGAAIDPEEARQRCEADARFYPFLLRTKRAERRWRQLTRRRYDALLPDRSTFE